MLSCAPYSPFPLYKSKTRVSFSPPHLLSYSFCSVIGTLKMAAEKAMMMDPSFDINNLSYQIFSILESKFLFGYHDPNLFVSGTPPETPVKNAGFLHKHSLAGKVRILSIDADSGILAAVALARLEASLSNQFGDPATRIADFFDVAAGSGTGGVLAAMLFTRGPDGRPLFTAVEALRFMTKNRRKFPSAGRKGVFRRSGGIFRRIFGESTLRDTIKPVLIPCYDLAKGAPVVLSRADAMEAGAFDFATCDVCAATCADKPAVALRSVDGRTRINAVGGGIAMRNPTAAAITHVLNNKVEFPFTAGVEGLLVVSLGSGAADGNFPAAAELVKIAAEGASEMVDQAVAMAFRQSGGKGYIRIQGKCSPAPDGVAEEELLRQRSVDSVMFQGRKLSEKTNGDRLEWLCGELIAEHNRRNGSSVPTVMIKTIVTPRTSSVTTSSTFTTTSASRSASAASL